MPADAEKIIQTQTAMERVRQHHEKRTRANYCIYLPFVNFDNTGTFKELNLPNNYNGSPRLILEEAAGALTKAFYPLQANWMGLTTLDNDLSSTRPEQIALDISSERILTAYRHSNHFRGMLALHREFLALGNGATMMTKKPRVSDRGQGNNFGGLCFQNVPFFQLYWAQNQYGEIAVVHRKFFLFAHEAVERFGNRAGQKVHEAIRDGNPFQLFEFIHATYERPDPIYGSLVLASKKPWASVYVNREEAKVCLESGYDLFPWIIVRGALANPDPYGYHRGDLVRPNAKGIQAWDTVGMTGAALAANPIMRIPKKRIAGKANTVPGGYIVFDDRTKHPPDFLPTNANLAPVLEYSRRDQQIVEQGFGGDKRRIPDTQPRSAEAVLDAQLKALDAEAISVSEIQNDEVDPCVQWTVLNMLEEGALPELEQVGLSSAKVNYLSPAFTSQKLDQFGFHSKVVRELAGLQQLTGDTRYTEGLDADAYREEIFRLGNIAAKLLLSRKQLEDERAERKRQQGMSILLEQLRTGAAAMKDLPPEAQRQLQELAQQSAGQVAA